MPDVEHNPNDYDPSSFASIMRRCFANVMHTYPVKDGEDGEALFKRVHRRIVPLRQRLIEVYGRQFKGQSQRFSAPNGEVVSLEQFGVAALNLINAGKKPEDVVKLSRTKLLELAQKAERLN